ncbi:hypothetical protein APHNP_0315 [Anaplasma phagocytophilum str. ApNP]|uniref:Uncharacterized protein n=1 Tax=Anaplasma phagocytophilum str. ApNP TaxID=1359153 RepID=A0A0F3NGK7_ANAPH|nr:hypothetical protein APHNP_0315 [Anaplasma phagocytophilum str. ApNP]
MENKTARTLAQILGAMLHTWSIGQVSPSSFKYFKMKPKISCIQIACVRIIT